MEKKKKEERACLSLLHMSPRHHFILSESRLLCWIEQLSHSELSWWWATVWKWAVREAPDTCPRANKRYQSCGALFIPPPPVNSGTRAYSRVLRSRWYLFRLKRPLPISVPRARNAICHRYRSVTNKRKSLTWQNRYEESMKAADLQPDTKSSSGEFSRVKSRRWQVTSLPRRLVVFRLIELPSDLSIPRNQWCRLIDWWVPIEASRCDEGQYYYFFIYWLWKKKVQHKQVYTAFILHRDLTSL